jgi:hypothetical protein
VVLAGLLLRLWVLRRNSGLTMDSPLYVGMAEQLGHELRALGPAHHGYPALIKLASLVLPGNELPGRMVSLLAGTLLMIVTWCLARRFVPTWGAAAATALVAFHPLLALSSCTLMTEASFQVLVYSALLLLLSGRVALGGVVTGFAYCVRPEAAAIALAAAPAARRAAPPCPLGRRIRPGRTSRGHHAERRARRAGAHREVRSGRLIGRFT